MIRQQEEIIEMSKLMPLAQTLEQDKTKIRSNPPKIPKWTRHKYFNQDQIKF